jgi:hypothetical protein
VNVTRDRLFWKSLGLLQKLCEGNVAKDGLIKNLECGVNVAKDAE